VLGRRKKVQTTATDDTTVLIVEDDSSVAELYAAWLSAEHDVQSASGGREALKLVDGVDVVFLDRQMPGMSGDEVLETIEARDLDCQVVMVTAIDPDFDIVDMPFDDYLTKPVGRSDLLEMVETMQARNSCDEQLQEYFSMASKKATLESEKGAAELDANEEYHEVNQRVEALREQANSDDAELDDLDSAFRDFPTSSGYSSH
jgi:DNA-binding response OmpR family regulator